MPVALYPKRLKSGYISVLIGNGASPEVFEKLCGATQRTFTDQKNTTDDTLDPCDDPEAIPYRVLQVTGRQADISLNLIYNRTQAARIRGLMETSESSNMRFQFVEPDGDAIDSGYYEGAFQATNLQYTAGGNAEYATATLALASDGEYGWVDGVA